MWRRCLSGAERISGCGVQQTSPPRMSAEGKVLYPCGVDEILGDVQKLGYPTQTSMLVFGRPQAGAPPPSSHKKNLLTAPDITIRHNLTPQSLSRALREAACVAWDATSLRSCGCLNRSSLYSGWKRFDLPARTLRSRV
eukprot:scaffold63_cov306-Pinguiococcus_pyrenoidosus.AAC.84